jgi:Chitobiase/beta-hexosaminidase C-terminal domain/Lamin Tail Domain/CotH kinase protein
MKLTPAIKRDHSFEADHTMPVRRQLVERGQAGSTPKGGQSFQADHTMLVRRRLVERGQAGSTVLPWLCGALWLLAGLGSTAAQPARFDLGDDDAASPVQPGWTALNQPSLSATAEGITATVTAVGAVTLDDRDRAALNGGGTEANMWRAFLFASGSSGSGLGLEISLSGLAPSTAYTLTLWAFDKSSIALRAAVWSANDGAGGAYQTKGTLSFDGNSAAPATLDDYKLTFIATAGADGTLKLLGVKAGAGTATSHNVFLNGFEVAGPAAPSTGPTDVALSAAAVGAQSPLDSLIGDFASTDPEPGDAFFYTLVAGVGSTHNALFALGGVDGEELRTAASLAAYPGQTLSIRVRSTDAHGEFFEKTFAITITNDSDADGLDDTWELNFFPTLATAIALGDNDADGLDNEGELARSSNPTKADTDSDGLSDLAETKTGNWVSPTNTGSDPASADGSEVAVADGFATDPNRSDSDGDGFPDPQEQSAGTSPLDSSSKPPGALPLRLSEIVASNRQGLKDGFGEASDWIEIYNPNSTAIDLAGYKLRDDSDAAGAWVFPAVSLPAQAYLVVFASSRDTTDPGGRVHTNFSLNSDGETVRLLRPDGVTVDDMVTLPPQKADVSFGRVPGTGGFAFFAVPTPAAANASAPYAGVVRDTSFSVNRGFFDSPISVTITTSTPGAAIHYTLDGTEPSATAGTLYSGPLSISSTTTLRAIATRDGWLPTNVDTQTYIFPEQVAQQPKMPAGFPTTWGTDGEVPGGTVPADYAMDPRVQAAAAPGFGVVAALRAIPTLSLVLPNKDLFDLTAGIYTHPRSAGAAWEREASLEMIKPDGSTAFQENCIVEIHGNSSRRPWRMQKHSFRVTFRSTVGPAQLDYNIFPDSPVRLWNKLVLRGCFTDSWGLVSWDPGRYRPNDSQYLRDVWMKESLRAMGQPSTHGTFCHLYINGLYWGLYNPTERIESEYFVERFGGTDANWEINNDFGTPGARWNVLLAAGTWAQVGALLDVNNFADYMLLHIFADAEDWPHHNGYAATNATLGIPFRFFVWDQEIVLDNHAINKIDTNEGAGRLFQKLRTFPEFRLLFADRVRRQMFNGGALTAAACAQRYLDLANRIDQAIVAESARWGDTRSSLSYGSTIQQPSPLTNADHQNYPAAPNGPNYFFTREQSWLLERDNVVQNYIPSNHNLARSYATLNKLRAKNLWPATAAPDFAQHGGAVPQGFALSMSHPNAGGTLSYTLDGSDPMTPGSPVYSAPVPLGATGPVKARVTNAGAWSALTEAFFIVGLPASAQNLVVSEIHYQPAENSLEEFVEVTNIAGQPIDLSNVAFTEGIGFVFPAAFVMAPGERVVVVRDQTAFTVRHGAGARIAGVFAGALDNGGEPLTLAAADSSVIASFRYDNAAPWPADPAGAGPSLTLINPEGHPDLALATSWRSSVTVNGTPGGSDAVPYTGAPNGDDDANGIPNIVQYALSAMPGITLDPSTGAPRCEFTRAPGADAAVLTVEISSDLATWTVLPPTARVGVTRTADGGSHEQWEIAAAMDGHAFTRVRVALP